MDAAMLSGMSGNTWEGTSSDARFFGKVREQNAGEVPVRTDDARTLSLAVAAREDGFEVAPDAPLWLSFRRCGRSSPGLGFATTGSENFAP